MDVLARLPGEDQKLFGAVADLEFFVFAHDASKAFPSKLGAAMTFSKDSWRDQYARPWSRLRSWVNIFASRLLNNPAFASHIFNNMSQEVCSV